MRTFCDYNDVRLLTRVAVGQRLRLLSAHGLTRLSYRSMPFSLAVWFAWNALLKMTPLGLELLSDINQHLFDEAGIRGSVAMRYVSQPPRGRQEFTVTGPV